MVTIRVFDGQQGTYSHRMALKSRGFRFTSEPEPHWHIHVSEEAASELVDWGLKKGMAVETPYTKRSSNYRDVFFSSFEPNFNTKRYLCAYCGIPLHKEKVSVDHIVAVKRAQRSRFYLCLLHKWGYENVNDVRNLAPCCRRCNSRKGTKAGLWVIRGKLGIRKGFWCSVWAIELFIGLIAAFLFLQ